MGGRLPYRDCAYSIAPIQSLPGSKHVDHAVSLVEQASGGRVAAVARMTPVTFFRSRNVVEVWNASSASPASWAYAAKLHPAGASDLDFGSALAVSANGSVIAIADTSATPTSTRVNLFARKAGQWRLASSILEPRSLLGDGDGCNGWGTMSAGQGLALSGDGSQLLVAGKAWDAKSNLFHIYSTRL